MKKFTFKVTSIDTYFTKVTVEAENITDAIVKVQEDLEACPIDTRSNTFSENDTEISPIVQTSTVESLFNIDDDESDQEVILVSDLTEEQKEFLGLNK